MRDCLLRQFDSLELPPHVSVLLERAHAIARGTEVAIRVARVCAVQSELGESVVIENADSDHLMALAGAASALLGDRLESLGEHYQTRESAESRRIFGAEQSSRGDA